MRYLHTQERYKNNSVDSLLIMHSVHLKLWLWEFQRALHKGLSISDYPLDGIIEIQSKEAMQLFSPAPLAA